jgi:hypothetical protein
MERWRKGIEMLNKSIGPLMIILLATNLLIGCVGTIEDKNPITTKTATTGSGPIPFAGIFEAIPISHNKVEVSFFPAPGNAKDLTYRIIINSNPAPFEVKGDALEISPTGSYVYTAIGLNVGATYSFSVGVRNGKTGDESGNDRALTASTFNNYTADFQGVANAQPSSGAAGQNEVIVSWVAATTKGFGPTVFTEDPIAYEVSYISADVGSPVDLRTGNSNPLVTVVQKPSSLTLGPSISDEISRPVDGLQPGTKYYFMVRAIHKGKVLFNFDNSNPFYKTEENNRIVSVTTLEAGGLFDWPVSGFSLETPGGQTGLSAIDMKWNVALGPFDHYRIYMIKVSNDDLEANDAQTLLSSYYIDDATIVNILAETNACTYSVGGIHFDEIDPGNLTSPTQQYADSWPCFPAVCEDLLPNPSNDGHSDKLPCLLQDGEFNYAEKNASDRFHKWEAGLKSFENYITAATACADAACTSGINSGPGIPFRVEPSLAPFSGILSINDPLSEDALDTITVNFDAPVTTAGFITDFELYCYSDLTDQDPTIMNFNEIVTGSNKANCDGLIRTTADPATFDGFKSFSNIEIVHSADKSGFFPGTSTLSDKNWCFGAVPVIKKASNGFIKKDLESAIIRCKQLEIKVPDLLQFQGAKNNCIIGPDTLDVTWDSPIGGIFNRYITFWKEQNGSPFQFANAIAAYNADTCNGCLNSGTNNGYKWKDDIASVDNAYQIQDLLPGKNYVYGTLTYIKDKDDIPNVGDIYEHSYSEINTGVRPCVIPLPIARFEEWMDIVAIGPKTDSRAERDPVTGDGHKLFETLNKYGQPVEVELELQYDPAAPDFNPTTAWEEQFGTAGHLAANFPGVYGARDNDDSNPKLQYSDNGIVRLTWKDITFNAGTTGFRSIIANKTALGEEFASPKTARNYGYKVYRSDDNRASWLELTKKTLSNPMQTILNQGYVYPVAFEYKKRADIAVNTEIDAVTFTDYSARFSRRNGIVDRARVYYYRVVPVFNNIELKYERETDNPQHIIKVIMPPPNMSFVSRIVANKSMCFHLGKTPVLDIQKHYTCDWNGIGSRGLSIPFAIGQTIYDFGSDMLIDRFELGCNYTRGDIANVDSVQAAIEDTFDFKGLSETGRNFKGCSSKASTTSPSNTEGDAHPAVGVAYDSPTKIRKGDCIGNSAKTLYHNDTVETFVGSEVYEGCNDPAFIGGRSYTFYLPGLSGNITSDCLADEQAVSGNYFNWDDYPNKATNVLGETAQSEYAAVYYNRRRGGVSSQGGTALSYPAPVNNLTYSWGYGYYQSSCMVNLPVKHTGGNSANEQGRWRPRWVPLNHLDKLKSGPIGGPFDNIDILSETLASVKANVKLYSTAGTYTVPDSAQAASWDKRYDDSYPLARIIVSNGAKLPPIEHLSVTTSNKICNTFQVEKGFDDGIGGGFVKTQDAKPKRLMRRTEGIVASTFPEEPTWDSDYIISVETGAVTDDAETAGTNLWKGGCNSWARRIEDGQATADSYSGDEMTSVYSENSQGAVGSEERPLLLTGSSYNDPNSKFNNTQYCQSRYGVQDLVGNVAEYSSEQFFCDFSGEKFYLGGGDVSNSVAYGQDNYDASTLVPWVLSDSDTGSCSSVETSGCSLSTCGETDDQDCTTKALCLAELGTWGNRSGHFTSGGIFNLVHDIFGDINTAVIQEANVLDQNSVEFIRNGDGTFLDFGQGNVAPAISVNDTLALNFTSGGPVNNASRNTLKGGDPRQGSYFSPVAGMPLECPGQICNSSQDNKTISWNAGAITGLTEDDFPAPSIPYFPVGNSEILSDGMSEHQTWTVFTDTGNNPSSANFIQTQVFPAGDSPAGCPNPYVCRYADLGGEGEGASLSGSNGSNTVVDRGYWKFNRAQNMFLVNFGSSRFQGTGRYSMHSRGLSESTMHAIEDVGTRCVIKLDE